jgi:hypothetical protein
MKKLSTFITEQTERLDEISKTKALGHVGKSIKQMWQIKAANVLGGNFDRSKIAKRAINRNVGTNSSGMRLLGMKGKTRADMNKQFKHHRGMSVRDFVTQKWNRRLGTNIPTKTEK